MREEGEGKESMSRDGNDEGHRQDVIAQLLDDEGDLSSAFQKAIEETFLRFSQSAKDHVKSCGAIVSDKEESGRLNGVEKKVILTDAELDVFTKSVNQGQILDESSKAEMKEYLNVDDDGNLTYAGFCEMYHLQSGSDEDETWKDLKALGYNDQLKLVEVK